jgi:putative addiction module component (TIGR02574 family)
MPYEKNCATRRVIGVFHLMDAVLPLDEMTVEEKLRAMEAIWRSLSKQDDQVPVPDWHRQLLDERQRQIDAGEAGFISLEEMKERVRQRTE